MIKNKLNDKGFAISGVMYPVLIIAIFLIIQVLFMMQNRKTVLDRNKKELVDTINTSNKVYTNEELSILLNDQIDKSKVQADKIKSLETENTNLKSTLTTLKSNVESNYPTKTQLADPASAIKTSLFRVYDGYPGSNMWERYSDSKPSEYKKATQGSSGGGIFAEFKRSLSVGLPAIQSSDDTYYYCTLITINQYGGETDFSGGPVYQIAIQGGKMYKRVSTSGTAWGGWSLMHN